MKNEDEIVDFAKKKTRRVVGGGMSFSSAFLPEIGTIFPLLPYENIYSLRHYVINPGLWILTGYLTGRELIASNRKQCANSFSSRHSANTSLVNKEYCGITRIDANKRLQAILKIESLFSH